MRIACLQFAPQVGDVDNNLNRADSVLSKANPDDLDLLVLPELAFSGYNFKSLQDITPFLEPSGSGITSLWARTIALKYNCYVTVGYPEKVDVSPKWPTGPEYYNSAIVVNGDGETIANYRKSFLYYTDETWALEGNRGFYDGYLPGLGNTSIGICMDLNPYKFEAPWHAFEFAFHVLEVESNLVIVSMAWMTREDRRWFSRMPNEPDMDTLTYWVTRLEPLIRSENQDEIIVVFCNRTGTEDEATYAGTSAVIGIQDGEVKVYGLLGRGEKELLVVDTNDTPYAKLVYRPEADGTSKSAGSLEKPTDKHSRSDAGSGKGSGEPKPAEGKRKSSEEPTTGEGASQSTQEHKSSRSSSKDRRTRGRSPAHKSCPIPPLPELPDDLKHEALSKRRRAPAITIPSPPDLMSNEDSTTSPDIPTPSAPSPTPMAIRPKLIIPESPQSLPLLYPISAASERSERSVQSVRSDESEASVQTVKSNPRPPEDSTPYPHSGAPLSGYPDSKYHPNKRIYGGHVTISRALEGFSPTTPFEDTSPASPRWFWRPSDTLLRTPNPVGGWQPGTPIGRKADPFPWPTIEEIARDAKKSLEEARAKSTHTPQETRQRNSQSPQSNTSSNKTKNSGSSRGTAKGASKSDSMPARPSSPKSRNASRSRNQDRSDSAMSQHAVTAAITQHLEHISQRAESVSKMRAASTNATPVPERPSSRNCSGSRPSDAADFRNDKQTIQIGVSPSILDGDDASKSAVQPPVSGTQQRPLSRLSHHHRSKSFSAANDVGRSSSADRSHTPGMIPIGRPESRAASRGRQPGPQPLPTSPARSDPTTSSSFRTASVDTVAARAFYTQPRGGTASTTRAHRGHSHGSGYRPRRHHSHNREMVEFERFEAIICPNCPVHGRRRSDSNVNGESSRSGAARGQATPRNSPPTDAAASVNTQEMQPRSDAGSDDSVSRGRAGDAAQNATGIGPRELDSTSRTESSGRSSSRTISTSGRSPATPPFFNAATPKAMRFSDEEYETKLSPGAEVEMTELSTRCSGKSKLQGLELRHSTLA
ncbi:hypothetical protein JDV02_005188 [Purpureocillium takamizusanense]|uniref:CN hydrolase domain-containing protein n=1 Tax=Purpureocillium takamizusanense TaxID=2060973 RepID=A0A9Q8QHG2_9HYPO|nr:uncharacterized protein JDV02_005188 [Purpureocillium takamizusanense]UNI18959.1 hypothetical protein JDV02_005188 [Purpureocillium takamizusanense]